MTDLPRDLRVLWDRAYSECEKLGPEVAREMEYMNHLPWPGHVDDGDFLSDLAWCVYNGGMRQAVIRAKWPALMDAFSGFWPDYVVDPERRCVEKALKVINHRGKAEAIVKAAQKVLEDSPIGHKLESLSDSEALDYLQTYPYIGPITRYHLARNLGFDVVKPDRHLVRLARALDYGSPDALVSEIAKLTGERKGFIDYVLWRWLATRGSKDLEKAGMPSV